MKAVLISIKPKWCELIASGEKTLEVRKTRPKLETPFKCYIYETRDGGHRCANCNEKDDCYAYSSRGGCYNGRGKVIGEFACDRIDYVRNYGDCVDAYDCDASCLSAAEIISYAKDKNGKFVYTYGWHISELKIYDKPKELTEFRRYCDNCSFPVLPFADFPCEKCPGQAITNAPQSWQYVEEADA